MVCDTWGPWGSTSEGKSAFAWEQTQKSSICNSRANEPGEHVNTHRHARTHTHIHCHLYPLPCLPTHLGVQRHQGLCEPVRLQLAGDHGGQHRCARPSAGSTGSSSLAASIISSAGVWGCGCQQAGSWPLPLAQPTQHSLTQPALRVTIRTIHKISRPSPSLARHHEPPSPTDKDHNLISISPPCK
eukprot:861121-Pelagomonas_calceolata.AAC.2